MTGLEQIVVWSLVLIFLSSAWLNFTGPGFVTAEFAHWGYPSWLRFAVGSAEVLASAALLTPPFRAWGAVLALAVLAGVVFSLSKTREWLRMEFPLLLAALCVGLLL